VSVKYLLPCPCGRQVVVEPRQAGETVPCSCGAQLQVPTLLGMKALDLAPTISGPEPVAKSWGIVGRLRLLGTVLVIVALVGGLLLHQYRPISRFDTIDPEWLQKAAQMLPPTRAWTEWERMKQGLDRRVDKQYQDELATFHFVLAFVAVIGLAGVGLLAVGTRGKK
jgi:hypothetical protein